MEKTDSPEGSADGHRKRQSVLLYLIAAFSVLGLGYVASRMLPLATPAFGEWAYHVVSSGANIQNFLSAEASRKVELPSAPQPVDEDADVDFGPLLEAFEEADVSRTILWPTRPYEVSVSVGGEPTTIVYHCLIEWFSWRVHDISRL